LKMMIQNCHYHCMQIYKMHKTQQFDKI